MQKSNDSTPWGCIGTVLAALIGGIFLLISTDKIILPPITIPTIVFPTPVVSAKIESSTAEYNILESSRNGIRIHSNFTIAHRKDMTCAIAAYFYYEDGSPVVDQNNLYTSVDGQVSVGEQFTPTYEYTSYEDFILFMPHDELELGTGEYDLKFRVNIYDFESDAIIAQSDFTHFHYSSQP